MTWPRWFRRSPSPPRTVFSYEGLEGTLPVLLAAVPYDPHTERLRLPAATVELLCEKHQDVVLLNQWDRLSARLKG